MHIEQKYHNPILAYLQENGAQGVNNIAAACGFPISSTQKYLERQDYFKKTTTKKWDLPEKVLQESVIKQDEQKLSLLVQSLTTQARLVSNSHDIFASGLMDLIKQMEAIGPILESFRPPEVKSNIPDYVEIEELIKHVDMIPQIIKKHRSSLPQELLPLLDSTNWIALIVARGTDYFKTTISAELADAIQHGTTEFSDEFMDTLKAFS